MKTIRNIAIILLIVQLSGCNKGPNPPSSTSINVTYEQIAGSKNHGPNGTWWGYNQSKIVRYGSSVYMYVIDNTNIDSNPNPNASNPSKIVIYKKEGDNAWQKGASLNTSRPGNILVDSDGIVHLIVFEPTYTQPSENGSYGKLKHYWFPNCKTGDITTYQQETIIDNDGVSQGETVNIRVGASIGNNDMIAVSFGMNQTHQMYYKQKNGIKWLMDYAGQGLGSDYYYPFVHITDFGVSILAIQDEYVGQNLPNLYQKAYYFEKRNGVWSKDKIIDLGSHSLASSRPQLVETSDIYQDAAKQIHLIYGTRLNPSDANINVFTHAVKNTTGWTNQTITITDTKTNWIRLIEYGGEMYYLCAGREKLYLKKGINGAYTQLDVPKVTGMYIYITSPRGGTSTSESYIDILMLSGYSGDYPNAKNYYVKIAKSELSKIQ